MPKIKTMKACVKCPFASEIIADLLKPFETYCIAKECQYRSKEDEIPLTKEEQDIIGRIKLVGGDVIP
jgi:hypothetical protein